MKKELHEIQWLECKVKEVEEKIVDGKTQPKKVIVSGPFMRAGVPNRNNRVYPVDEANKAIRKLRPMVKDGRVRMMVDHPDFFSSGASLSKVGALLTDISDVDPKSGYAYYEAIIVDTAAGKDLKAILEAGSKIGVSTRGYGLAKESEVDGFPGKYEVISDWDLTSIDFVDDPAVLDTETYMNMRLESKRRSNMMFKNLEELKAACPELVKQLVDSSTTEVKEELQKTIDELSKKLENAQQVSTEKVKEIDSLVESIKRIFPEKFTVVEESTIIANKDKEIDELKKMLESAVEEVNSLKAKIKQTEDEHIKKERISFIEHLKAVDPEYFTIESFKDSFENCITKDEVKKVYESNSKVIKEMKEKIIKPAASKSKQTDESATKNSILTDEQKLDFIARNSQRRRNGLDAMSEAKYLEMFGKKE